MDVIGLMFGLLLVWAFGIACVAALPRRTARGEDEPGSTPWIIGTGGLAGLFLATLWLRVLSLAGVHFSAMAIALPLLAATLALGAWIVRRRRHASSVALGTAGRAYIVKMAAELSGRLAGRVRAHALAPVAGVARASRSAAVRGGRDASALSMGRVDAMGNQGAGLVRTRPHRSVRARGCLVWRGWRRVFRRRAALSGDRRIDAGPRGQLPGPLGRHADQHALLDARRRVRARRVRRPARDGICAALGAGGTWLVSSLPLANAHVALAGYADLPLAIYFCVADPGAHALARDARARRCGLALLLLAACPLLKIPGRIWAAARTACADRRTAAAARTAHRGGRICSCARRTAGARANQSGNHGLPPSSRLRSRIGTRWPTVFCCTTTGICSGMAPSRSRCWAGASS